MGPDPYTVDYIIVGSGAAGSVLADRLSEDPACQVLVLEAGGPDRALTHLVPANFGKTSRDPRYTRHYVTEPFGNGRVEHWHTGRIAGGSTTVNGMIWNRGWAGDYDEWAAAGITGWNWLRFLRAFRALEGHALGVSGLRGADGRQSIAVAGRDPASDLWIATLAQQGINAIEDLNGSGDERVAYAPLSVSHGTRVSAARAYLHQAARRPNVHLELHCEVQRIVFDGTTATGVEVSTPDGVARFAARREVIVCAGTTESPLLLERSGVGDPDVLKAGGVEVVVANPAVGENLRQHRGAVLALRLTGVPGRNRQLATPAARLRTTVRYLLRRSGALAHGGTTVLAMLRSTSDVSGPDIEVLFTPVSVSGHDGTSGAAGKVDGATVAFYPHAPTSTGSIHLTGPSTYYPPRLVPGYLSTGHDRELTVAAFHRVRELLAADPFASVASETAPGSRVWDDESVLEYVLDHGFAGNHQIGTCRLGPDGVVDDELRVRGTQRLRVADASVMPTLTTGNTVAPSMAIGWIAGDLIRDA